MDIYVMQTTLLKIGTQSMQYQSLAINGNEQFVWEVTLHLITFAFAPWRAAC